MKALSDIKWFDDGEWVMDSRDRSFEDALKSSSKKKLCDAARAYRNRYVLAESFLVVFLLLGVLGGMLLMKGTYEITIDHYNSQVASAKHSVAVLAGKVCSLNNDSLVTYSTSSSGDTVEVICENKVMGVR